jgi:hypothetical protein
MFAIVLIVIVAVGIAWPFLRRGGLIPAPIDGALQNVRERLHFPTQRPAPVGGPNTPTGHTEQLCPQCTSLNPAGLEKCQECGAPLLASNISDLWSGPKREEMIQEGIVCALLLGLLILAMVLSQNLPPMGKTFIILGTIGALTFRFVRSIGE